MNELLSTAQNNNIDVMYTDLPENGSVSVRNRREHYILLDYSLLGMPKRERVHLAHEIGHCMTGSFYNIYSPFDVRTKHEHRANIWAIHNLTQFSEIKKAMRSGYTEAWQLAEYFDVTDDFMQKAIEQYKREGYCF